MWRARDPETPAGQGVSGTLPLAGLALVVGLWPVLVVHVTYGLSLHFDKVPACVPYLDGCLSISAASRQEPAIHVFRLAMLPFTALFALFWLGMAAWLRRLDPARGGMACWIALLGVTSAAFMALYATFLGTQGAVYELLRRYGVTVCFAFAYLAQLLLVARLQQLADQGLALPRFPLRLQHGLCVGLLLAGLLSIPVQHFIDFNPLENVIEWNFALVLQICYALNWPALRATACALRLEVVVSSRSG
ncbi:MAG TPA: hypothetical protein VNL72_05375 [Gammaproteobacteria bacterium]|nr:hypothetical protein [Gammaproteobacteria bacterium]